MALALGRTVDELIDSITVEELNEWKAYYILEPFGPKQQIYHDYYRMGTVCALQVNMNKRKGSTPAKPEDFIPAQIKGEDKPKTKRQTLAQQRDGLFRWAKSLGARVVHKKKEE